MNIDHLTSTLEIPAGLTMIRRIGSGGAGNIFMVQDITGKLLALKSIDPRWQQKELDSITFLRNLPSHPAVTQIYQTGQLSDGSFFYTMELADNAGDEQQYVPDTLARRIGSGKLAAADILYIIRSVTGGVIHLHKHQLFHGDIKPENIIFINGQAKISDFGTLAGSGNAGTAEFIPDDPVNQADRDCYALAKTLYCAYSGCDASDFPSPPENFDADEFRIVRKLYIKGCAGQAGKRFAAAADWENALNEAIDQITHPPKTGKFRIKTAVLTGGIILLIGIALTFLTVSRKTGVKPNEAVSPAASETQTENVPPADNKPATSALPQPHPQNGRSVTGNNAPYQQIASRPIVISEPQKSSPVNYYQSGYAGSIISGSQNFRGDFISFPDFRKKFETVYREMPDQLDADFCRQIIQYYADLDRFFELRRELSSPEISSAERTRRFRENNYRALYKSLSDRNIKFMSVRVWIMQFRLVQQLYGTIDQQTSR